MDKRHDGSDCMTGSTYSLLIMHFLSCEKSGRKSGRKLLKRVVSSHEMVAGAAGFEPAAFGFGDRRSTN